MDPSKDDDPTPPLTTTKKSLSKSDVNNVINVAEFETSESVDDSSSSAIDTAETESCSQYSHSERDVSSTLVSSSFVRHSSPTPGDLIKQEIQDLQAKAPPSVQAVMTEAEEITWPSLSLIHVTGETTLAKQMVLEAMQRISENVSKTNVRRELEVMADKIYETQALNVRLENLNENLMNRVEHLELKLAADPRIMKVLKIAELHRKENSDLTERMTRLKETNNDLLQRCKELDTSLKSAKDDIIVMKRTKTQMKDLEKHCEKLEKQLISKDNKLNLLEEQRYSEDSDVSSIKRGFNQRMMTDGRASVSGSHLELDNKIQKLRIDKMQLEKEIKEHSRTILKLNHALGKKSNQLKGCRIISQEKMGKLSANKLTLKKFAAKVKQMKIDRNAMLERIGLLNYKLGSEKNSKEIFKGKNHDLLGAMSKNSEHLNFYKKKNRELGKRIHSLTENLNILKGNYRQLNIDNKKLQESLSETKALTAKKETKIQHLEKAHLKFFTFRKKYREMLNGIKTNLEDLINKVVELRGKNFKLDCQNTEILFEKKVVSRLLEKVNETLYTLKKENEVLYSENKRKTSQISDNDFENLKINQALTHMTGKVTALTKESKINEEIQHLQKAQSEQQMRDSLTLEHSINDCHETITMLENDKGKHLKKISQLEQKVLVLERQIASMEARSKRDNSCLTKMCVDLDKEFNTIKALRRQCLDMRAQRDVFGCHLLEVKTAIGIVSQRNAAAENRIKSMRVHYLTMQNDVNILKLEVTNLRRKLKLSESRYEHFNDLKEDHMRLQKDFMLEKKKNLSERKDHVQQIHPWRNLKYQDKSRYELTIKVVTLTKKLIKKTVEVTEKEELIFDKDVRFQKLMLLITAHKTPMVSPTESGLRATIRTQCKQLKGLHAELNMKTDDLSRCQKVVQELQQKINYHAKEEASRKRHALFQKKQVNQPSAVKLPPINFKSGQIRYFRPHPPRPQRM